MYTIVVFSQRQAMQQKYDLLVNRLSLFTAIRSHSYIKEVCLPISECCVERLDWKTKYNGTDIEILFHNFLVSKTLEQSNSREVTASWSSGQSL